jgi:hydroxyacylglutathione hydrolase
VRYGGKVRDIMSKKATEFQRVAMSRIYRGKEIFKPLNTGWIDENVACVREWVANIFFYRRGETTIMIDAGYNYDRLAEKMGWLEIDAKSIRHILITHQDTDHVGAVEADGLGLFKKAKLYIGEIENRYLTGEVRRRVMHRLYKLPQVTINNKKQLLKDGETFKIGNIKIHAFLVPGHTWGHMVYLIDDKYLFTGDTIWFGADGGYSFISALAESNKLAVRSLGILEQKLKKMCVKPLFITGHTGFTDNFEFAFAHKEKLCSPFKKKVHDPSAPYDAYDESDDTERNAKNGFLKVAGK